MNKRVIYLLALMLFLSKVGVGQLSINVGVTKTYNGFGQNPGFTSSGTATLYEYKYYQQPSNTYIGFLAPKNIGAYSVKITLMDGPDVGFSDSATYNIIQKTITLTANANTKVYDGTISATSTPTITGSLASGDIGTYSETYDTKTQGTGKILTPSVVSIVDVTSNLMTGNYSITYVNNLGGIINYKLLTVTAENKSKKYGEANPTLTYNISGFVNNETLTTSGVTGTASTTTSATVSSTVNTYTITASAGTLSATNYSFNFVNGTLTVDKSALTVTATDKTKIYGDVNPQLTYDIIGYVNNESLTTSGVTGTASVTTSATLTSTVNNYPITSSAGTLTANNYIFNFVNGKLTITPKDLTISGITATNKVYDGTIAATLSGTAKYEGLITDDVFAVTGTPTAVFDNKDAGNNKSITVNGYTAPSTNYNISQPALTANITTKDITISGITATNKVYDGTTAATLTGTAKYDGIIVDEVFSVTGTPTAKFASKDVGTNKSITITGYTSPSNNYSLTQPKVNDAAISPKPLSISAPTIADKIYDATKTPGVLTIGNINASDFVGTEKLSVNGVAGNLTSANVGTYTTTITYTLGDDITSGGKAANYTLSSDIANAKITPKIITPIITVLDKQYDGSDAATITIAVNKFASDNLIANETKAVFSDANAALAKTVTITGIALSGTSASNYQLNASSASVNGNILPRVITVSAKPITITFGDPEPKLDYDYSPKPLIGSDQFSGNLTRDPGTAIGTYKISQGTLSLSTNYAIKFNANFFEIKNITNPEFLVPNAFIPSSMNELDNTFRIFSKGLNPDVLSSFRIFNRLGNLIYTFTKGLNDSWDGRINGIVQEADVYMWAASFDHSKDPTGTSLTYPTSGTFLLLK